jgi:hypothetical protein
MWNPSVSRARSLPRQNKKTLTAMGSEGRNLCESKSNLNCRAAQQQRVRQSKVQVQIHDIFYLHGIARGVKFFLWGVLKR